MRKTLNTEAIANELHGASAFFQPKQNQDLGTAAPQAPDTQASRPHDAQAPGHPSVQTPRPPDTKTSRHLDATLDLTARAESRQTLRLTEGEFRRLGVLQEDLSELLNVTRVDKNDILRAGLHRLLEDFAELKMGSDLVKRLRQKYR